MPFDIVVFDITLSRGVKLVKCFYVENLKISINLKKGMITLFTVEATTFVVYELTMNML